MSPWIYLLLKLGLTMLLPHIVMSQIKCQVLNITSSPCDYLFIISISMVVIILWSVSLNIERKCTYTSLYLPLHVSHPFWYLSIIHVIQGYAMLCFQGKRTPIINARGLCNNSHKSEVWQSCFLSLEQKECIHSCVA